MAGVTRLPLRPQPAPANGGALWGSPSDLMTGMRRFCGRAPHWDATYSFPIRSLFVPGSFLSWSKEPVLSLPKEPVLSLPKEPVLSLPKEPVLSLPKGLPFPEHSGGHFRWTTTAILAHFKSSGDTCGGSGVAVPPGCRNQDAIALREREMSLPCSPSHSILSRKFGI